MCIGAGCGEDEAASSGTSSSSGAEGGGGSAMSAAGGAPGTGGAGGMPSPLVVVGNVADVKEGELASVPAESLFLGRDAGGIWAMTSLCSHKFCDMVVKGAVTPGAVRCTCHSSKFDLNGAVLTGPASKPLEHYFCEVAANGDISVDDTQVVDAAFRAAIA